MNFDFNSLKPHQQRVVLEAQTLSENLEKLRTFLETSESDSLSRLERAHLIRLMYSLEWCYDLLNARINAFDTPEDQLFSETVNVAPTNSRGMFHSDNAAVDKTAVEMKLKLAKARAKGRGGWDDPEQCTVEYLAELLLDHLVKGDPVDVANFAMMLHNREGGGAALAKVSQQAFNWRDPVLERLWDWQTRIMNEDGDRPGLEDLLGGDTVEDLLDYVLDVNQPPKEIK